MKDWDYYRRIFIEETIFFMYEFLTLIGDLTPIEKIMAVELYKARSGYGENNFRLAPQHKIMNYTADFYIEYQSIGMELPIKIVIECDGHEFHEKTKQQASKDKKRDRDLTTSGYLVLRYSGSDIVNDPYTIHRDLNDIINKGDE